MEKPQPTKEHLWLHKLAGEWTSEVAAMAGSGAPEESFRGTVKTRSIDGLWMILEGRSEEPGGGTSTMIITLGYDPRKERFVGTFLGSMMPSLWIYEGTLDAAQRLLTLNSEGQSFTDPGKNAPYRDMIELVDDDHWILRSSTPDKDGNWNEFCAMHYRRKR